MARDTVYFTVLRKNDKLEYHVGRNENEVARGDSMSRRIQFDHAIAGLCVVKWFANARRYGCVWVDPIPEYKILEEDDE